MDYRSSSHTLVIKKAGKIEDRKPDSLLEEKGQIAKEPDPNFLSLLTGIFDVASLLAGRWLLVIVSQFTGLSGRTTAAVAAVASEASAAFPMSTSHSALSLSTSAAGP